MQVVYGSRFLPPPGSKGTGAFFGLPASTQRKCQAGRKISQSPAGRWSFHRLGVTTLNLLVRLLYGVRLTDEATCYKALPTSLLRAMDLRCERFEFCPEVTAKVCRLGLRILEVPIGYNARGKREGKKIRWRDGVEAMATLWRWRKWRPGEEGIRLRQSRG